MKSVFGVSFFSKNIYYFNISDFDVKKGDYIVAETERGLQLGEVVTNIFSVDPSKLNFQISDIIRIATDKDIADHERNVSDCERALVDARDFVRDLNLEMNILDANYTLDRKQLIFNFLADERVDFRELARKLAAVYKTRIELRQIGVRDKARIVGGYGQCGRKLCCGSFLDNINSVSINMAKNQGLALNPQKINGVCGRLMCCLSYENDCYSVYKKGLPKAGSKVFYDGKERKVISVDVFNRSYKLEGDDAQVIDVRDE
ncbi:MAG: regulatory iron-sulfur-containing complex subunit RicT [bacterium]|nr:regulatory iron-sulfur-containing complex subunit RicT [bacterium]